MVERYFEKFPTITYGNTQVKDITERVIFTNNTLKNPYVFYPYTISQHERADQFAFRYYEDPYLSWLLYITNNVTDPYYEWYLDQDEFREFIAKKYGSIELAQSKIKYYRSNWENGDTMSISEYDALPAQLYRFWEPQYGVNGNVVSYARKKEDTIINTNNLRAYTVSNTNFIKDEVCYINFDTFNQGRGQVVYANNNLLILQHTSGVTLANSEVSIRTKNFSLTYSTLDWRYVTDPVYENLDFGNMISPTTSVIDYGFDIISHIIGSESGTNAEFTTAASYANNMLPEEAVYYSPVTYYDYENEINESRKSIQVLDSSYSYDVAKQLKELLK